MARKIKFPLKLADGTEARTLDELREHFDVESVIGYFKDGRLLTWLKSRYYDDEAQKVSRLTNDNNLPKNLCAIFGVETELDEIDVEKIAWRQERLNRLKQYTDDKEIFERVDQVAFDQEDLSDLLDEDKSLIYLCANKFVIPLRETHKTYIGVGKAIAIIRSNKIVDFDALNIEFKKVIFDDDYQKIIDAVSTEIESPVPSRRTKTKSNRVGYQKAVNELSLATPKTDEERVATLILKYVGGSENVQAVEHCVTRLKLVVKDNSKIQEMNVENIDGVKGQFFAAQRYQIILGTGFAERVANAFKELLGGEFISLPSSHLPPVAKNKIFAKRDISLFSPIVGTLVPLNSINDPVFASGAMGRGIAVKNPKGKIFSPFDGELTVFFPTGHALGLKSDDGIELLIHVGMDTVKMNGRGFTPKAEAGDRVTRGQLLLEFSPDTILKAGYETTTPIVVTNHDDFKNISFELDDQKITIDVDSRFIWKHGKTESPPPKKSGCFITTAICENFGKPDDCYELTTFRNFRDTWLAAQPDGKSLIAEYYSIAPAIVKKINSLTDAANIYKNLWQKYLEPCLKFIERGDNQSCKRLYIEMVTSLKKNFLGG